MLNLIPDDLAAYCRDHSTPEGPIYREITAYTLEREDMPQMLSGPEVGALLQLLVRLSGARQILEIGAFTGYSALKLAEAQPPGSAVHTCEIDPDHAATVRRFAGEVPWGVNIQVHEGAALETLETLPGPFDLVFIDADKANYPAYVLAGKQRLRPGGMLVLDNALWSGRVLDPQDDATQAIAEANRLIRDDPELHSLLLPVRDGLMLAWKIPVGEAAGQAKGGSSGQKR